MKTILFSLSLTILQALAAQAGHAQGPSPTEGPCQREAKAAVFQELTKRGANPGALIIEEPITKDIDPRKGRIIFSVRVSAPRGLVGFTAYQVYGVSVYAAYCNKAIVTLIEDVQ